MFPEERLRQYPVSENDGGEHVRAFLQRERKREKERQEINSDRRGGGGGGEKGKYFVLAFSLTVVSPRNKKSGTGLIIYTYSTRAYTWIVHARGAVNKTLSIFMIARERVLRVT